MSIVVLGVNHRSAPLDVIEKVTISSDALANALQDLLSRDNIRETVVLSTCNRTEVYAVAERFHAAHTDILEFLCETSGLSADEITPHLYSQFDDDAVVHLFEVAAGIDSAPGRHDRPDSADRALYSVDDRSPPSSKDTGQ